MVYVILSGNTVIETHEAPVEIVLPANSVVLTPDEADTVGIGSVRQQDGSFSAKPVRVVTTISKLSFAMLFTQAERIAIRSRQAGSDGIAAALNDFYSMLDLASDVDLAHPITQGGIAYMVTNGLLTQQRAAAILANQSS